MLGSRKRSADGGPASTQKKRKSGRGSTSIQDGSLLIKSLNDAQLFLHSGDSPHILGVDQATFIKTLSKDVSTHLEYPNNIETMLETLYEYLEDVSFLRKSLNLTKTSPDCDSARSDFQDSVLRLLLCVPDLQTKLMSRLLEILAEIALDEGMESNLSSSQAEESPVSRLILSAVRFLPFIVDGAGLAEKIVEIIQACPTEMQKEIISSLPEIVEDSQHENIAGPLKDILDDTRHLTCTILDSLSSMSLSRDIMKELLNTVLKRLYRVGIEDLPSVVDFILCSNQSDADMMTIVQDLRNGLDISPPTSTQNDLRTQSRKKEAKDIQCIIMENIQLHSLTRKPLCDAWLKCIDGSTDQENQKPLDILVLVCLHDIFSKKRSVENIIKNKIRNGLLTEAFFRQVVTDYTSVIKKYFPSLISICDTLLQSPESVISNFAISMYNETFICFVSGDTYYQQEIIGDLISKVGTGGGGLITDGALRTLEKLAENHSKELVVFTTMITAMMDFTENMNLGQFRQLMHILCTLAWQPDSSESGSLQTEINIMIKKQICSKSPVLKKMGVIAVVNAVRAMGKSYVPGNTTRLSNTTTDSSNPNPITKQAKIIMKMIDLTISETKQFPEAAGLFMDELASPASISEMPDEIAAECSSRFQDKFEVEFVEDYVKDKTENADLQLPIKLDFKIDEYEPEADSMDEDSGEIAIPISRWVLESKKNPFALRTEMFRFIPHFRLMGAIKKSNSEESEIDALLGCGVLVVLEGYLDGKENLGLKDLDSVCDIVFLTINWFRETVNYFSVFKETETRRQILVRLKNILFLEERLKGLLSRNPQYRPPAVLFSEDTNDWTPPTSAQDKTKSKKGKGKKGGKGKGKGKGKPLNDATMNGTMHLNTQTSVAGPVASSTLIGNISLAENSTTGVDLAPYRPFFRELDLTTLHIFSYVVVTTESEPTYEEEKLDPKLRPAELLFLLKDIAGKVERRLVSGGKKKGFPGQGFCAASTGNINLMSLSESAFVEKIACVLPKIFANLDVLKEYFQRLIRLNDGIMDCVNMYNESCELFSQCIKFGFEMAASFFSWNGFQSAEKSGILLSCLKGLVERVDIGMSDSVSIATLAEKVVQYLMTFTENIVSSEVAGSHLTLLDALVQVAGNSKVTRKAVAKAATTYAKNCWQTSQGKEKGALFNVQVEKFFSIYLEYSENILTEMMEIFDNGVQDVFDNKGKDYNNETYQTISRGSLGVIYRVTLQKLSVYVKKITYGVTKDKDEQLEQWATTTNLLHKAVNPLKTWRNRSILMAVLKLSKPFLDHFLKHGMILLESMFKRKGTDCINIIKTLQTSTRYLHYICSSTKTDHDIALANHVPFLKKSLEAVVYRVQAMMAANNCGDAFWMGNLKNRDLQGEEILSQVTEEGEEEEDEEEEDEQGEQNDEEEEEGEDDATEDGEGEENVVFLE